MGGKPTAHFFCHFAFEAAASVRSVPILGQGTGKMVMRHEGACRTAMCDMVDILFLKRDWSINGVARSG
jgi:hypothetical protein